ncbi:MAG: hypothetical protein KA118_08265, partial [Verrucomicrobia bacterium]|nr:hypothetical protein [Verrucomicrobiota bacterium]
GSVMRDGSGFTGAGSTRLESGVVVLGGVVTSENLVVDGAALDGGGSLGGTAFWESGSIATNGALTVASNGLLVIESKYSFTKFVHGALTNAGTILFRGIGNLQIGGVLHNRSGGLFDIQTDYDIGLSGSAGRILNEGVFRKSSGTDRTVCAAPFANHGVVDVQTGSLILSDGSLLSDGCAFTGLGKTRLESGTNRVDGVIHSENLVLDGATLVGAGNVTGSFLWSSGVIDAGLSFHVTPQAVVTISSPYSYSKYLNGSVTNAGTVNFLGKGSLILSGTFHNLAGGLLDVQTDYDLVAQDPAATVVNEGIVRKTATAGTTAFRVPFYNAGVVEVGTGTLHFASNYHHSGTATILLAGGTMETAGQLLLEGGVLSGWGTLKPGASSSGALTSAATIAPATNATLAVQGDFTQLMTGTLELALDAPLGGAGPSRLSISGSATLGGVLGVKLANGYLPNPSDTFNGISFHSRAGDFHCFNGFLLLGRDRRFLTQYSATNLALATVAMPDPADPPIRVAAQDGSAIVCWPAEFVGCQLYWSTNIVAPVWTPLPDITHRYIETPMVPHKFFHLREP